MLTELLLFVVQTAVTFFTSLLLFRFYCHLISLNLRWVGGNFGFFVLQLTDWLVLPLRRLLPSIKKFDTSTWIGAFLCQFVYLSVKFFILGASFHLVGVSVAAFFELLSAGISFLTGLIFISILMSWISTNDQIKYLMEQLVEPLLRPLRAFIPLVAGIDLSPLVFLLLLQIANIVLQGIYRQIMI
jgi:YggT family protein